jgi:hypothetical protein
LITCFIYNINIEMISLTDDFWVAYCPQVNSYSYLNNLYIANSRIKKIFKALLFLSLFNFAFCSLLFPHCLRLRFVLLMLSLFNVAFCFAYFIIVSCCALFCWIFSSFNVRLCSIELNSVFFPSCCC